MTTGATDCELCIAHDVVAENSLAYVRYDNSSLSRGHVLVIPKRHVAGFFDMTANEQAAVLSLLNRAQRLIQKQHAPDGYNIGVNIGKAGGAVSNARSRQFNPSLRRRCSKSPRGNQVCFSWEEFPPEPFTMSTCQ